MCTAALCGEAVKAHREGPGDVRRSKCAARVRSSPHRCKDIESLVRVGSRHFRELEEKSPGSLVFVSPTILIHVAVRIYDVFIEII